MESISDLPKPKLVTGGCLCGAIRYRADFAQDHDFAANTGTCQCTQCRRNTGSLFFACVQVPKASFRWLKPGVTDEGNTVVTSDDSGKQAPFDQPPSALRSFSATPGIQRGFCAACGGFLFWMKEKEDHVEFSVGSIDPLFLVGPSDDPDVGRVDMDGQHVPREGYGKVLAGGYGRHLWCWNEIKGVTDGLSILGEGRGERRGKPN